MMTDTKRAAGPSYLKKLVIPAVAGAILGFGVAWTVSEYADGLTPTISQSAVVAMIVGGLYILLGLFVFAGTVAPGLGAQFLNVEDEEDLREQRVVLQLSCYAMAVWGGALVLLALAGENGPVAPDPALVPALGGIVFGLFLAWRSYRRSDELMAAVNQEAAAISYFLVFLVLGGWGALAQLGFAPPPAPIDLLSAFYLLVLFATFIAAGRRGMLDVKKG